MGRRLLIVAVFLLAGAVVNVAVAWGCIMAFPMPRAYRPVYLTSDTETRAWWHDNQPDAVTDDLAGIEIRKRFGWRYIRYIGDQGGTRQIRASGAIRNLGQPSDSSYCSRTIGGFPMMSVSGEVWLHFQYRPGGGSFAEAIGRSGLTPVMGRRSYPFHPIWSGFAVNTILYAMILWLLSGGPFRLRRWNRVRRGLCPKCAYPSGESDVCSECGKELPERVTVA